MDRFVFTNDLLTGLDDVDSQHRMLFHLANQIIEPETDPGTVGAFYGAISFLSEYVQYHFAAEELAMQRTDYPERERHCRSHAEFRAIVAEFIGDSLEAPEVAEIRRRLAVAVSGWLVDHIRMADKALAAYLRSHPDEAATTLPTMESLIAAGMLAKPIGQAGVENPPAAPLSHRERRS